MALVGCGDKSVIIEKERADQIVSIYKVGTLSSIHKENGLTVSADYSADDAIAVSAKDPVTGKSYACVIDTKGSRDVVKLSFSELIATNGLIR